MTGTQPLYALPNASMVPPAQEQLTPSWPLVHTNQTGLQSGYTQAYTLASQLLTLPKLCSRTSRQPATVPAQQLLVRVEIRD